MESQHQSIIRKLQAEGKSYSFIADYLGISKQRVHQLRKHYKSPYKRDWRTSGREFTRSKVRERDNQTCQQCHKVWSAGSRRFDVHHLNGLCGKKSLSYDRISEMDTLITLCHKCHFNHDSHSFKLKK